MIASKRLIKPSHRLASYKCSANLLNVFHLKGSEGERAGEHDVSSVLKMSQINQIKPLVLWLPLTDSSGKRVLHYLIF